MSTGCTRTTYLKSDSETQISEMQRKIDEITKEGWEELLVPCQWLESLKSNTKEDRVTTITTNIERQIECYYLNEAKLKFLEALRQYDNGRD